MPHAIKTTQPTDDQPPARLSPALADHLGFLLAQAHLSSQAIADRALAPLGLEIKHYVALAILADEGRLSQHQLGERMRIDRTTMVALVDRLEAHADVARQRNPDDRRAYALQITPHGHDTLADAKKAIRRAERQISSALTAAELRQLKHLLTRLADSAIPANDDRG